MTFDVAGRVSSGIFGLSVVDRSFEYDGSGGEECESATDAVR
jgi:hypothetical protein